jgi:thiamine biosynthesis protein ThiS
LTAPYSQGVRISLNGEEREVPEGTTVASLVTALMLPAGRLAVEHNRRVVPKGEQAEVRLSEGDRLELVSFVGGG